MRKETLSRFLLCFILLGLFTACVSHYLIEGSVRLQLGNDTEDYTIEKFSIVSKSGRETVWIDEEILPREKSKVRERDFAGTFTAKLYYKHEGKSSDTSFVKRFEGGSVFLQIKEKDGVLKINER